MKKQILITVKAYPNPSTKYSETVCCAGIDLSNNQWIRLYPIPYRDLDNGMKFRKYSIIEVDCYKANDDKRPESYRVNSDSIKIIKWLDTNKKWQIRKSAILKLPTKSMCQVNNDARDKDLSLGLIKPEKISFEWKKQSLSDTSAREACYAQLSFFNKSKDAIEEIPYNFYYIFHCAGENNCPGHRLSIIDWEIGQAYRSWRSRYNNDEKICLEKIKQRWDEIADANNKDVYFFVGNMKRFRDKFMILGVFFPPY